MPRICLKNVLAFIILLIWHNNLMSQKIDVPYFCADSIEEINKDVRNDKYGKISSLLIFHDTKLLYEKYYGFSQRSSLHPISSVTKSVTSIAVGVCLGLTIQFMNTFQNTRRSLATILYEKKLQLGTCLHKPQVWNGTNGQYTTLMQGIR